MWKLLLQEIFGINSQAFVRLSWKPEDLTEHYRKNLSGLALDRIIVCSAYEGQIERSIHRFKYERIRQESNLLAPLLFPAIDMLGEKEYLYTWIPVGFFRYLSRWFNQSAILAQACVEYRWEFCRSCLTRFFSGKHQARLNAQERLSNAKNSFRIKKWAASSLRGKHVVLVDDVISTGATANECAKVLKNAWAASVAGIFLARTQG